MATSLTNGINYADAFSVFVTGTDVYVCGFERSGTNGVAKLWKNGVATALNNGANDAEGYSVFVSELIIPVAVLCRNRSMMALIF